jgi:hypothetical protein
LVIDLTGNGLRFGGLDQGIVFDVNGYDHIFKLGWPIGRDDGWIVLDRNLNGRIDDGSEMFGNATRLADGTIARNGFYALADLDVSGDGYIDASDPGYQQLRVWLDSDRNGNSESGELHSLVSLGVARLSTDYWASMRIDRHGNRFLYRSRAEMIDGSTRPVVDVFPVFQLLSRPPCARSSASGEGGVRP